MKGAPVTVACPYSAPLVVLLLDRGVQYVFRVSARNVVGYGEAATEWIETPEGSKIKDKFTSDSAFISHPSLSLDNWCPLKTPFLSTFLVSQQTCQQNYQCCPTALTLRSTAEPTREASSRASKLKSIEYNFCSLLTCCELAYDLFV